jgi:O-acetyl-ADP-ribose deacetylase (regulator of RNase III)
MKLGEERSVERISFPSISTGVYGYPVDKAARVALEAVSGELAKSRSVKEAIFVLFDGHTLAAYESAMAALKEQTLK